MALFDRKIEVAIEQQSGEVFDVADLRMNFEVNKSLKKDSNSVSISLWNMAENSRNAIRELDDKITIKAGYLRDVGVRTIFTGQITKINHAFEPPNVVSKIEAGDGVKTIREARGFVAFRAGTKAITVLEDIASKLELTLRPLPSEIAQSQYVHGFSHAGSVTEALTRVTDRMGLEWSIQNNELQIQTKRKATESIPVLTNIDKGLLEAPQRLSDLQDNLIGEKPRPGYKIKTLLDAEIEPGARLDLEFLQIEGTFRVESVKHLGDNDSGEFISVTEVVEI